MAGLARRTRWKRSPPAGASRVWDLNDVLIRSPQLFYFFRKSILSALLSGCCVGWESYGGPLGCRAGSGSQGLSHCPSQEQGSWGLWDSPSPGNETSPWGQDGLRPGWDVGPQVGLAQPCPWPGRAGLWGDGTWPCWGLAGAGAASPGVMWGPGPGAGGRAPLGISRGSVAWWCPQAPDTFTPPHSSSELLSYSPPSCCLFWLLT